MDRPHRDSSVTRTASIRRACASSRTRLRASRLSLAPDAVSLKMSSTSKPPRSAKAVSSAIVVCVRRAGAVDDAPVERPAPPHRDCQDAIGQDDWTHGPHALSSVHIEPEDAPDEAGFLDTISMGHRNAGAAPARIVRAGTHRHRAGERAGKPPPDRRAYRRGRARPITRAALADARSRTGRSGRAANDNDERTGERR